MDDTAILSPGQRLRKLRKLIDVRQDEFGGEKFSKNYISMFENSKRNINPINAAYLAKRINLLAEKAGKNISISAAYFLKTEKDIACDRCRKWIKKVEYNSKLSDIEINTYLNKIVIVSKRYELFSLYGRAMFLMGLSALNRKLYKCAITKLLDSLNCFLKLDYQKSIVNVYKHIGIAFYNRGNTETALVYFDLVGSILKKNCKYDLVSMEEISYYKNLCLYASNNHTTHENNMVV